MAAGFLKQGAPADDVALWVQYGNTFPVAKMELMLKGARTHDPRAEQLAMLQRAAAMEILKGKVTPQMALSLGGPTAVERNWLGIRNQVNPEGALTGLSQMMRQLMLGGSGGPIIEDDVANRVAGNLGVE
jgi:hypothetical protein